MTCPRQVWHHPGGHFRYSKEISWLMSAKCLSLVKPNFRSYKREDCLTLRPADNFPSSPVLQPTLQKQNLWLQTTNELLLAPGLISFHCNINDPNKPFQLSCCTAGILLFGIWSLYKKIPHASSSRPAPSKGNKITFLLSLSLRPTQGQ